MLVSLYCTSLTFVVWQLDVLKLSIHHSCGFEVRGRLADLSVSRRHGGSSLKETQQITSSLRMLICQCTTPWYAISWVGSEANPGSVRLHDGVGWVVENYPAAFKSFNCFLSFPTLFDVCIALSWFGEANHVWSHACQLLSRQGTMVFWRLA